MTQAMTRFEHGGDIYTHPGVVDFSANLNPLGMPARAKAVLRERVDEFDAYPDPQCRELVARLSKLTGVAAERIVCTAGASDLLLRLCLAIQPKKALVTAPCFSGYEHALEQVGVQIVRHTLREEDDFDVREDFLQSIVEGIECVFLCSPNNPTGRVLDLDLLDRICQRACQVGAVVVLDECFITLSDAPSFVQRAQLHPNIVVMRAFTKTFSMAGLRLGYGLFSDEQLAEKVRGGGNEWAVSTPAQLAGVAALDEEGFVERSRAYVTEQRESLMEGLRAVGLRVVPAHANYILVKSDVSLYEPLLQRGVMVRRCENYHGLGAQWFRVAVRTREDNQRLLEACKEVCARG